MSVEQVKLPPAVVHGTQREVVMEALRVLGAALNDRLDAFLAEAAPGSTAAGACKLSGDRGQLLEVRVSVEVLDAGAMRVWGQA